VSCPSNTDIKSPWEIIRQDEVIRAEIRQDVQRLPDEANYHNSRIQDMVTDILFIYCRANPNRGGYRQGMHELLAPFVHVLETDAVDSAVAGKNDGIDEQLLELTNADFIEHDAYILFSALMDYAQIFYAVDDSDSRSTTGNSADRWQARGQSASIVERSKFIHQVCLQKVDPELAMHLTSMEVLPQIFLM
jgi:TBC1 domain family member 5